VVVDDDSHHTLEFVYSGDELAMKIVSRTSPGPKTLLLNFMYPVQGEGKPLAGSYERTYFENRAPSAGACAELCIEWVDCTAFTYSGTAPIDFGSKDSRRCVLHTHSVEDPLAPAAQVGVHAQRQTGAHKPPT